VVEPIGLVDSCGQKSPGHNAFSVVVNASRSSRRGLARRLAAILFREATHLTLIPSTPSRLR
jgi:hypothetical protein